MVVMGFIVCDGLHGSTSMVEARAARAAGMFYLIFFPGGQTSTALAVGANVAPLCFIEDSMNDVQTNTP